MNTPDTYPAPDRTQAPPVQLMTTFSLPDVRRRRLPSGIEMIIYDRCDSPVNMLTWATPGGNIEYPSTACAALISILRREGTASYSGEQINDTLDRRGAWLKTWATDHYSLLSMRSLNSSLPAILPIFREMAISPVFPDDAFRVRRDALARTLEVSADDVDYLANCASDRLIKGADHPGARIDTPQSVLSLTAEELRSQFSLISSAAPPTLFLAGQITTDVEELVADTFSSLPAFASDSPLRIIPYSPAPALSLTKIEKPDALQSSVFITIPVSIRRSHPDYIPLHIAVSALGGYFGSRLMLNIRERLGLTYGISASLMGSPEGTFIQIAANTDASTVDELCIQVNAELTRMAAAPPEGEELLRLKQSLISAQAAALDTPFSIIDQHITSLIASIPPGYFEAKLRAIDTLTPSILTRIAARYFDPAATRTAFAGR